MTVRRRSGKLPSKPDIRKAVSKCSVTTIISILALLVSIGSMGISYRVYMDNIRTGELIVHKPTGFCIVRGFPQFHHPSDFLVITATIENTGRGIKNLENLKLFMTEQHTNQKLEYEIAGTIPSLVAGKIGDIYEETYGFSIPGHSVERYNFLFRHVDFWKEGSPGHDFRFTGRESWDTVLHYYHEGDEVIWGNGSLFFTLPIYETIDKLSPNLGDYHSDCFSFH